MPQLLQTSAADRRSHETQPQQRRARRSLRTVLLLWFLGIALLPLGIVSWLGYRTSQQAQLDSVRQQLLSVVGGQAEALDSFFTTCRRDIDYQAHLADNQDMMRTLVHAAVPPLAEMETSAHLRAWTRSAAYQRRIGPWCGALEQFQKEARYHDIMLADAAGNILFSCRQDRFLGTNLLVGPLAQEQVGTAFDLALQGNQAAFSGFLGNVADGRPSAFLMRALHDDAGDVLGLVVFRILAEQLAAVSTDATNAGGAGLQYLVDGDLYLLTVPAEYPGLRVLQDVIAFDGRPQPLRDHQGLLESAAPGEHVAAATMFYRRGFDGRGVIGVHQPLTVLDEPLGVIAEINRHDATAGLRGLVVGMVGLLLLVTLGVVLASLVVSRRIVQPLVHLEQLMEQMAGGAEVDDIDVGGHNEVGDLADKFAVMVSKLQTAKQLNRHQYELKRSQFELHECMRGLTGTQLLADAILRFVATHYNAEVGVFYRVRSPGKLSLAAAYGVDDRHQPEAELKVGEGVVGRAAERLEPLILKQLPDNHLSIISATGAWSPANLIVMPIHMAGQIKGVVELGLLADVTDDDLEFLKLSNDSIAAALDGARSRERVDRLLDETRRQARTLAEQQAELRQTNEQLARSDRYKSEFLANMSHELRTPLNSMLIMSQVLAENRDGNLSVDDIEAASTIHKAGSDLLSIINDILDLSRVEAGKLELHSEELNVRTLTTSLDRLFRPVSRDRGLDFRVLLGPELPETIVTDSLRVSQILKNLLNNAFKFTQSGSVVMRVRRPSSHELAETSGGTASDWLVVSVADTGIGMSQETLERIFEDFSQGDGTIGRRFGGSGLGLSISRKLADLLGARIRVESVVGKGSTFTLLLRVHPVGWRPDPLITEYAGWSCCADEEVSPSAENEADNNDASGPDDRTGPAGAVDVNRDGNAADLPAALLMERAILLADDDMRTLFGLSERLIEAGASVHLARNWQECLTGIRDHDVDLALVADRIAGRPDEGFAARLRAAAARADLPVIVMAGDTGHGEGSDADAVLDKPVATADLCTLLKSLLAFEPVPAKSGGEPDRRSSSPSEGR